MVENPKNHQITLKVSLGNKTDVQNSKYLI